jgi:hypothetical protein
LHGVQVRHAISAHCCSGLSEGAHGGVPGTPHTGSAEATPTPTKPPKLIEAATAPVISNRFIISSLLFCRSDQGVLHLSQEPPDGCCCVKRSAPEDGPAYSTKPARESAKWNRVFPYVLFAGQGSSSTRSAALAVGEGEAIATYQVA